MHGRPVSGSIDFSRMSGFPRLFSTYCTDYKAIGRFFGGDWGSLPSYERVASKILVPHREIVAAVLEEQNVEWGGGDASALRSPDTLAVVTGQQLGVFGGPLYTVYKALTAVKLAAVLSTELGRCVVPIFWLEGADHDLDEIAGLTLLRFGTVSKVRYHGHTMPESGNLGSVAHLTFSGDIERMRAEVAASLVRTEFSDDVLEGIFAAYREGTTVVDAFARSMAAIFRGTGLVLANPEVPDLKRLVTPLFQRELNDFAHTMAVVSAASAELLDGYHAQIRTRPTNLYMNGAVGREGIVPNGAEFILRPSGRHVTEAELKCQMGIAPEAFSPNVALRPMVQDTLLPTIAYVAGPGEVSYFAQLKGLYDWAGVPMPVIYPRASITVVESKVQRVLDKYDLNIADVGGDLERLFQRLVLSSTSVESAFEEAASNLGEVMQGLGREVEAVDPTLGRTSAATKSTMLRELGKLRGRVVRAVKRNNEVQHAQLGRVRHNLYPAGKLQERTLPMLYFLNKYGPAFVQRISERMSLDIRRHQVVTL